MTITKKAQGCHPEQSEGSAFSFTHRGRLSNSRGTACSALSRPTSSHAINSNLTPSAFSFLAIAVDLNNEGRMKDHRLQ
jgi:hypothetical protein